MTWGDDVLTVLPGTLAVRRPRERGSKRCDAAVIMKLGRNFAKVRARLARRGLLARAIYVERGTMEDESSPAARRKRATTPRPISRWSCMPGQGRRP